MARPPRSQPTEGELEILKALWEQGPSELKQVCAALRRGRPVVIVDANEPIPGLVGVFRRGSKPKYFKGPQRPRLGDLAYTEYGILGV